MKNTFNSTPSKTISVTPTPSHKIIPLIEKENKVVEKPSNCLVKSSLDTKSLSNKSKEKDPYLPFIQRVHHF